MLGCVSFVGHTSCVCVSHAVGKFIYTPFKWKCIINSIHIHVSHQVFSEKYSFFIGFGLYVELTLMWMEIQLFCESKKFVFKVWWFCVIFKIYIMLGIYLFYPKANFVIKWHTPKLFNGLNYKSKGEDNGRKRSWSALPNLQHFKGKRACWNSGMGLGRLTSTSLTHTDLHKPNNKLVNA
jgi:hypothetical protein